MTTRIFEGSSRSTWACAALSLLPALFAVQAHGQLTVYHTDDESAIHDMPTGAPGDPWQEANPDGSTTITLAPREKIWFAFRNEDDGSRDKYLSLRFEAPTPADMQALETCLRDEAEGYMLPDDSVPVRTVFGGAKQIGNRYVVDYRMTPQPLWERFCFKCVSPAGIDGDFKIELFTSCTSRMDLPPWSAWFNAISTTFGAPGAMIGDPRFQEIWLFPRTQTIDHDQPAIFEADLGTGPWSVETVLADPDGNERPNGGYRFVSDGAGLSVHDRFDVAFATQGASDIRYDLFAYDAEGERLARLTYAGPTWSDALDEHEPGALAGIAGWTPWNDDPAASAFEVTADVAASAPHALAIDGDDDAVQSLFGYTEGVWTITAKQFVPAGSLEPQFFILLNTYETSSPEHWSLQLMADAASGQFVDYDTGDALPLVTDEWAEIRVLIDLDTDEQTVFYNGNPLVTKSWTAGVAEGGALRVAAVNLYGGGSGTPVYYDDLEIVATPATGACTWADGTCDVVRLEACDAFGGTYAGHATECPDACAADVDGSGDVGFGDAVAVLSTWGECAGCPEDVDGDGIVGFLDLVAVLTSWGPCED